MPNNVLIVDDARDWREMLAGMIKDVYPDWGVTAVSSRDEALETLRDVSFGIAVLDIRLDESDENNVDGLRLARDISGRHPTTKVIIVTGYANLETVKIAMHPDEAGTRLAFDYILKEKVHLELLQRLAMLLEK